MATAARKPARRSIANCLDSRPPRKRLVAAIVQYLQAKGILTIQEAIGAKPDARPMAKTLQQVGKLIDAASAAPVKK